MKSYLPFLLTLILVGTIFLSYETFADKPDDKKPKIVVSVEESKKPMKIKLEDGSIAEKTVHIFYKQTSDTTKANAIPDNNYKDNEIGVFHHKPGHEGGPGGVPGGDTGGKCYEFIDGKVASWQTIEPYIIDPRNNNPGLSQSDVRSIIASNIAKWNTAAGTTILGSEVPGTPDGPDGDEAGELFDDRNEILFAAIDNPGVIAIAYVWGFYFENSPKNRILFEWDVVFDDPDFDWGDSSADPTLWDFDGISNHEIGHGTGMGHPDSSCTEETMYGFAIVGETKKRDLNFGDIKGIQRLY